MREAIGWWLIILSVIIVFMMTFYMAGYFDLKQAISTGIVTSIAIAIFIVGMCFLFGGDEYDD